MCVCGCVYEACSSWDFFHQEINRTRQVLINNRYSNARIDEKINKYLNRQQEDKNMDKNNDIKNVIKIF